VPLVGLIGPKQCICAVNIVHDTQHSITLVEFHVVEVVGLWRGEKWKVVARVGIESGKESEAAPEPDGSYVGAKHEGPKGRRKKIAQDVFQGMCIQGYK